jgi:Transposase DDE domain
MRGSDERSGSLFSYVDLEARVRGDHPLRVIRQITNAALGDLSKAFTALYTDFGRGLVVGGGISTASGTAEREAALVLIDTRCRDGRRRITLGADKAYDVTPFVHELRGRSVTPHIAIDGHLSKTGKPRKTAVDGRTTRHLGYDISQRCRKRIEEVFGWIKGSAGLAKVKLRGRDRVDAAFTLALVAYNLVRLPKLLTVPV